MKTPSNNRTVLQTSYKSNPSNFFAKPYFLLSHDKHSPKTYILFEEAGQVTVLANNSLTYFIVVILFSLELRLTMQPVSLWCYKIECSLYEYDIVKQASITNAFKQTSLDSYYSQNMDHMDRSPLSKICEAANKYIREAEECRDE